MATKMEPREVDAELVEILQMVFTVIGLLLFALAFPLVKMLTKGAVRNRIEREQPDREELQSMRPDALYQFLRPCLFVSHMIGWAMMEAIAIFGFTLATMASDPAEMQPFLFVSALGLLALSPRFERKAQDMKPLVLTLAAERRE